MLTVTSMGNAGVLLENSAGRVYIDSFFQEAPGVGGKPHLRGNEVGKADLILITHRHRDHLDLDETIAAVETSGATVVGPANTTKLFADVLPPERIVTLEPAENKTPPASQKAVIGDITVTAYRTYHGRSHNSYLIDMGGVRIYHDADNEQTQPIDIVGLGHVDLLLLCPWAGSGSGEFVNALKPDAWLLIHMTDEEIAQHRRGVFLPPLISPVPDNVYALSVGERMDIQ